MIGVIDYGAGNLRSVANALTHLALPHRRCNVPSDLDGVSRIILPGVGNFLSAARRLKENGMGLALRHWSLSGRPLLGICLGLQLLFEHSEEGTGQPGLGVLPGRVVVLPLRPVPHMGWNDIEMVNPCLWLPPDTRGPFYFAHSFFADVTDEGIIAARACDGGFPFPVVVGRGRTWGVQFHPEKSGTTGLALLSRFGRC